MAELENLIEKALQPPSYTGPGPSSSSSSSTTTATTTAAHHETARRQGGTEYGMLVEDDDQASPEGTPDVDVSVMDNSADWPTFMRIVDEISRDGSGQNAKRAAHALLEHLNDRDAARVYLTLLLLETLCKNCDDHLFHHLDNNDFKRKMTRIARGMTGQAPAKKSLELIQQLALDPHLSKAFSTFRSTYSNLKKINAEFPYQQESQVPAIFSPTPTNSPRPPGNERGTPSSIPRERAVSREQEEESRLAQTPQVKRADYPYM
jgi:hypothetical protein